MRRRANSWLLVRCVDQPVDGIPLTKKFHPYIDDTGSRFPDRSPEVGRRDHMDCFGFGGFMIHEEEIGIIVAKHRELCAKWDIDYPLHSTDIRGTRRNFGWLAEPDIAKPFLLELEEWILSLPIIGIACSVHRPGYVKRYKDCYRDRLWLMCKTAYSILIERAAKFAEREGR